MPTVCSIMKRLVVLVAVVLVLAVLPCQAVEPPAPVTCDQEDGEAAARLAMFRINVEDHRGYMFRLNEIESRSVEQQGESDCKVFLQLGLLETTCHAVNTKHFEECELRERASGVKADCNVTVTIKNDNEDVEWDCHTERIISSKALGQICPDCPTLLPLNDPEGLKVVQLSVNLFNKNVTNPRYYVLRDVGRVSAGYIMGIGMYYSVEFALVETHCPMGTRIVIDACKPLCPERAHHTLCHASSQGGELSLACEIYGPADDQIMEQEPTCHNPPRHGNHHHHGPPPHGPPPHGPPPHGVPPPSPPPPGLPGDAGMPPFHSVQPLHPLQPCHGAVQSDPVLHPICPRPHRLPTTSPRGPLADAGTPFPS